MLDPLTVFTSVIGLIALLVLLIAAAILVQVLILCRAELRPFDVSRRPRDSRLAATRPAREWAKENEFEFVGYYTMLSSFIAVWRRKDRPTFFCLYRIQHKTVVDLFTLFDRNVTLTTGSSLDGQLMPPSPGHYLQSFSRLTFDEQWDHHIEGENYLIERGGAELIAQEPVFEQIFCHFVREQMQYVRSLSVWPLRGVYWFFIRRYRFHNRSLADLHTQHKISLPNETIYRPDKGY